MGRELPGSSDEQRPRRSRADEAGGYGPPSGERSSGRREGARGPGGPPPRNGAPWPGGSSGGGSGRSSVPPDPTGRRPNGNGRGGGVIRSPLGAGGPDAGESERRSSARNGAAD